MEVGAYDAAEKYLLELKNMSDYNYLIRLAKWNDYKGDLDTAIKFMEKARDIAVSRDSKPLKIWTFSNLGDYYGHAGRLKESYAEYLKTLALQPDNTYVLKGIAWMAYSGERNPSEALRILDSISSYHDVPDYHLLRSDIYASLEQPEEADREEALFLEKASDSAYGIMYKAHRIEILSEKNPSRALEMVNEELDNRPTPEIYHLLALSQLRNGDPKEALETIEKHVFGKTFEPMAAYHMALVFKANGLQDRVAPLKAELLEAGYELGPLLLQEIEQL